MIRAAILLSVAMVGCSGAAARWVEEAAAANARADAFIREGQPDRAGHLLEQLASKPAPAGVADQDRLAVLQDAYARLAALALEDRRPAEAVQYADAGLALGEHHDVFASSLHTVRGRALESLGRDAEAVREYEAALLIAESLLAQALSDGGGR